MSNRLKFVLPKLVSSFRTCCILGRDIADTTSSIRDLIEIIENDDLEAYLIKVDQEKAFDKVDHDYLFLVLEKIGFGPKFMQWIKIFYNNINSSVKCNGFLTKSVNIPKSNVNAKIFQHADDTNIFTSNKKSVNETFKVLNLYSEASGAKINRQKSEIMSLGSGSITDSELDKLQIQKCENVTKVLGIYVGKDKELCELLNWKDKIKKIKTILFFWNKRDLTLPGRATALTSLIMSRRITTNNSVYRKILTNEGCLMVTLAENASLKTDASVSSILGKQVYKADCSNAHLTHIPDFPKSIKVVILDNNLITTIPDYHFRNNSKLCNISLMNNKLKVLKKDAFYGAYNLIELTLYNNEIKDVDEKFFKSIPALKYLNIKKNHFDWLKLNITFPYSLQTLRMDFKILEQDHMVDSFKGLINLKTLDISGLSGECECKTMTPETFRTIPNLIHLDISACKISYIYRGTLKFMSNLTFLDASFNFCLKFAGAENITYDLKTTSIKILKLNKIHRTFEPDTIVLKSHIRNLRHTNLTELHMDSNRIQLFEKGALSSLPLTNSLFRFKIEASNVSENSLAYLDFGFNLFYSWIGPLLTYKKLIHLDLSNNFCSNVSKDFFKSSPNLKSLLIHNNLLGFVLIDDMHGEILQHIPKLEVLNLADNRIPYLPYNFFKFQTMLKEINIGGNLLDDLSFQISHMQNLSHLDLSKNRFSSLNSTARGQLETITKSNPNLTVNLSDNPLICSCDTIQFIKWMSQTKIKFTKLQSYKCKLYNGNTELLKEPKRNRYQSSLRKKCDNEEYEYDAFISYEEEDAVFVHNHLLSNLEEDAKLKLCIHKRDFQPGKDIAANITFEIHNSRHVVAVLSQTYLESYWCLFEYNMARMESIYSRNCENMFILVSLVDLSALNLPLCVLEKVHKQSYIEYPNDPLGNTLFWDKLKEVLK
ncbi:TLR4 [Mytilus coruscus]|uniref:TLR4 n=1 Tax=Mytilus coruscus TaxID=42192 RepID=A0A6J8BPZ2_MYTCO|nr:TLR4 [Mytilus coruscus]